MPQFQEQNSRAETSGLSNYLNTVEEDEENDNDDDEEQGGKNKKKKKKTGEDEKEIDENEEDDGNPYVLINRIPLRKTKEPRTHRCPRCFCYFTRPRSLRDHFPKCVSKLGNPDNLR